MCQRYVIPEQVVAEREFLPARAWWKFEAQFNVAAPRYVPAVRLHEGSSEGVMMRWGLIPAWAEGREPARPMTSVRRNRIERSKIYGAPWLNGQRCILPIAGFYAWQMMPESHRQPFFIRLTDRSVFGVAALWDRSESEDGDVIESCAVISVPANDLLKPIANTDQRMPAILRRRDYERWLKATPAEARAVLQPYRPSWMQAYPVSPRVNSAAADDAGLIQPLH